MKRKFLEPHPDRPMELSLRAWKRLMTSPAPRNSPPPTRRL